MLLIIIAIVVLSIGGLMFFLNKPSVSSPTTNPSQTAASQTAASQTAASQTAASQTAASQTAASQTAASQTAASQTTTGIIAPLQTTAFNSLDTFTLIGSSSFNQTLNMPSDLTNIKTVSIGGYHTIALKNNGTLIGWGYNSFSQATIPSILTGKTISSIETGDTSSFALLSDKTIVSWGASIATSMPNNYTNVSKVVAGINIGLVLIDGTVNGWGSRYRPLPDALNRNIVDIATPKGGSGSHSLALTSSGGIIAWGFDNSYNQLTIPGGTLYSGAPTGTIIYTIADGFKKVLCGEYFSVALKTNNTAIDWGSSGNITTSVNNNNIKDIVIGYDHIIIQNTSNRNYVLGGSVLLKVIENITNAKAIFAGGNNGGYII